MMLTKERALVSISSTESYHSILVKGPGFENGDLDWFDVPVPEQGMPSFMAVVDVDSYYYEEFDEVEYESVKWRLPTSAEWTFIIRGDYEGLFKHWSDIPSAEEVSQNQ